MDRVVFSLFLIFKLTIEISIFSIIPITIILILNKFLNNKIPVKYQYILYVFIFIRLISPVMPKSPLSLFNKMEVISVLNNKDTIVNMIGNKDKFKVYDNSLSYYREIDGSFNHTQNESFLDVIKKLDSYTKYLFLLWCIGVSGLILCNILAYIKFYKEIKYSRAVTEKTALECIAQCKNILKIKSKLKLIELTCINSPAVFGIKNPVILIPKGLLSKITVEDFKNILLHELCHYKRKDMLIIYLCKITCIVYCLNPLVWYAKHQLKKALELSCDEKVLSCMNKEERINYGYTIVNLASYLKSNSKMRTSLNIVENKKDIARRVKFIRDFKIKGLFTTVVSFILLILTGTIILTECNGRVSAAVDKDISCNYVIDHQGKIRKVDNINTSFKSDDKVLGKWVAVDFVRHIEEFNPSKKNLNEEDLYLKQLEFFQNGTTAVDYENVRTIYERWTKDFVLNPGQKIASKYYIKNIQGIEYMFFQWKSGDYTFRNAIPHYYVLKKVK